MTQIRKAAVAFAALTIPTVALYLLGVWLVTATAAPTYRVCATGVPFWDSRVTFRCEQWTEVQR